jgi:hypothetical protein
MVNTGPIRGDFPSLKLGRMVRYGSTIERDLLYFLEYWQHVTWYQEQPMTIEHVMADGHRHRYTPDYEIHEGPTKSIAECKPTARLASVQAEQQRQIGLAWADTNGYRFVTFTDTELRIGHQLENLKLLWRYARLRNPSQSHLILDWLVPHTECQIDELCQQLHLLPRDVVPVVCHLVFHQQLHMDLNQPFSTSRTVWIEGK